MMSSICNVHYRVDLYKTGKRSSERQITQCCGAAVKQGINPKSTRPRASSVFDPEAQTRREPQPNSSSPEPVEGLVAGRSTKY
jgi:hypothetical protein